MLTGEKVIRQVIKPEKLSKNWKRRT